MDGEGVHHRQTIVLAPPEVASDAAAELSRTGCAHARSWVLRIHRFRPGIGCAGGREDGLGLDSSAAHLGLLVDPGKRRSRSATRSGALLFPADARWRSAFPARERRR